VIARIPQQQARDRQAMAEYLRDLASKVDRIECDPYGVVVVFVGPDAETVGSRGLVYAHDYRRAETALFRSTSEAIRTKTGTA
jgi:hypothetical protein